MPRDRRAPRSQSENFMLIATIVAVGGAVLFTFAQLHPSLLFTDTTPAGGDMGAHVWTPAYLRDHLLPNGRLTGWAPDWYAGFPALTFYFPLPSLLIVALDVIAPYNVAFKLVSVSGLLALPVAAWFFGRMMRLRFPGPALLGVAMVPFLFDRSFTIYGGNIASTLAGEFSFSISLAFALVFLGLFARGLETGRYKAGCAALLAVTGLCHVVPAFFALAGAFVLIAMRPQRRSLRFAAPVLAVAGLLAGFWIIPFMARISYTNDMGWEKLTNYWSSLFPKSGWLLVAWAFLGIVLAIGRRSRTGFFLGVMAGLSAVAFIVAPQSRLWNARLLPFWFLSLALLAGFAAGQAALAASDGLAWLRRRVPHSADDDEASALLTRLPRFLAPVAGLAYVLVLTGMPLAQLPSWAPWKTADRSFVGDWSQWNYSGYERKAAYPEYRELIDTMKTVSSEHGCGRAMWEYESELDRFGTPMALMLLPYWTDGCVGSMEGLFFESSATTPYHFLNQSELSARPSRPQRDLPYRDLDIDKGVRHMQELGVRYYMVLTPDAQAKAKANPDLTMVAETPPRSANTTENGEAVVKSRPWQVYRVTDSALVEGLSNLPAVMTEIPKAGRDWQDAAVEAYNAPGTRDVLFAASGPESWPRVPRPTLTPPRRPTASATVTNIETTDDRISFTVDRPGTPVVVKTSYFPNWKASGADGPWRVAPNLMVVVPTSKSVTIRYATTPVDTIAMGTTVAGFAGLGLLVWRRPRHPDDGDDDEGETSPAEDVVEPVEDQAEPGTENPSADWLRELAGAGRPPHPG